MMRGPGTNTGHGHVWKRPDGIVARCGGPTMCKDCAADQARLTVAPTASDKPDKALDVYATAANLRRWAKALKIPSGEFVNEDLSVAADLLDNYAKYLTLFRSPQDKEGARQND